VRHFKFVIVSLFVGLVFAFGGLNKVVAQTPTPAQAGDCQNVGASSKCPTGFIKKAMRLNDNEYICIREEYENAISDYVAIRNGEINLCAYHTTNNSTQEPVEQKYPVYLQTKVSDNKMPWFGTLANNKISCCPEGTRLVLGSTESRLCCVGETIQFLAAANASLKEFIPIGLQETKTGAEVSLWANMVDLCAGGLHNEGTADYDATDITGYNKIKVGENYNDQNIGITLNFFKDRSCGDDPSYLTSRCAFSKVEKRFLEKNELSTPIAYFEASKVIENENICEENIGCFNEGDLFEFTQTDSDGTRKDVMKQCNDGNWVNKDDYIAPDTAEFGCFYIADEKEKKLCSDCLLGGTNVWTAIGCVDTSQTGITTRLLQIGLGIIGGVMIVRIMQGAIMLQTENPEQIKEAREILLSTVIALIVMVGALVILRFLGVNILSGLIPADFFT